MIVKILAGFALTSLFTACSSAETTPVELPAFCEIGQTPIEDDKVYFDLEKKKAFVEQGHAYNADLRTISTADYVGIYSPMHLLTPTDDALKKKQPLGWNLRGYKFTVDYTVSENTGWVLVRSRIIEKPDNSDATTAPEAAKRGRATWHVGTDVLYSPGSGIIAYQDITHIGGEIFSTAFYRCSEAKLAFDEIKKAESSQQ